MMSRGIICPLVPWRKPVSIECEISVLISITSPRLAVLRHVDEGARRHGCRSSRQAASVTTTSCVSDQNVPSRQLGDRHDLLRVGEADARRDARLAGARPEPDADHVRLRVLLVEDVDRLDVIVRRHRAVRPSRSSARCCRSRPAAAGRASPCPCCTVGFADHVADRGFHLPAARARRQRRRRKRPPPARRAADAQHVSPA